MEYKYSKGKITLPGKELTILDELVLDFIRHLDMPYVIVSGYVAILFGRSRSTEDIDIFIEDKGLKAFSGFYNKVVSKGKYWVLNGGMSAAEAYDLMTADRSSLRFAENGTSIPNFEVKFAMKASDYYSLRNALVVDLGRGEGVRISPLEIGIAYKLHLGSEKDFADAKYLFITMGDSLDVEKLKEFLRELNVRKETIKSVLGEI